MQQVNFFQQETQKTLIWRVRGLKNIPIGGHKERDNGSAMFEYVSLEGKVAIKRGREDCYNACRLQGCAIATFAGARHGDLNSSIQD